MSLNHYFKKPEYYFRPLQVIYQLLNNVKGVGLKRTVWDEKIEVDTNETIGRQIAKTGLYDLSVTEALWSLINKGDFVIDVGANIGYTTNLSSFRVGMDGVVWAFEPNPLLMDTLSSNVRGSKFQNTVIHSVALSDLNKDGFLVLPEYYDGNKGVAFIGSESSTSIKVALRKLDDLLPENSIVGVMKIDVEGHELSVLKGAANAIAAKRIKNIVFEDEDVYPSETAAFLLQNGFQIFRIEQGWTNIVLKDPASKKSLSSWESTNYLATIEASISCEKIRIGFYKCLR